MNQLELSIMPTGPEDLATLERLDLDCQVREMSWETAWADLMKVALYQHGPDVSQIGSSWISNLAAMRALRPFTQREIIALGGADTFVPASWEASQVPGRGRGWAIPWLTDARVIFYWRDMLQEAGVDEQSAFQTPAHVEETLDRLQTNGVSKAPWANTVQIPFLTLQNVASWIWGMGGELVSAGGRNARFSEPAALAGARAYFGLHRYLPPGIQDMQVDQIINLFVERQAAVTMGLPNWLHSVRQQHSADPDVLANLGVALPPGPSFVGGSGLVVWRHSRDEWDAVDLVRQLISQEAQLEYCQSTGYLPARLDVLHEPPYSTDPHYRVMVKALKAGRSFPTFRLWGLVEERLGAALSKIWGIILDDPSQDLDAVIAQQLEPLNKRLEETLSGMS
jgi:multiple sugar transport system substrate-binding protein